jgi:hypothetical protein
MANNYRHRFDFDIGYLVKSPCRGCIDRYLFPDCMNSCILLDKIRSVLGQQRFLLAILFVRGVLCDLSGIPRRKLESHLRPRYPAFPSPAISATPLLRTHSRSSVFRTSSQPPLSSVPCPPPWGV